MVVAWLFFSVFSTGAQAETRRECDPYRPDVPTLPIRAQKMAAFILVHYPEAERALTLYAKNIILPRYETGAVLRPDQGLPKEAARILSERFYDKMISALKKMDAVDLFYFGHGGRWSGKGILDPIPMDLRQKIRLFYSAGCGALEEADYFIHSQVGAYVSHEGQSVSPVFAEPFLDAWFLGARVRTAVDIGNNVAAYSLKKSAPLLTRWGNPESNPLHGQSATSLVEGTHAEGLGNLDLTFSSRCW